MGPLYVAWWNVENLFDEEHSPRRSEKMTRVLGNDLRGWTSHLRDRKISQLASVIAEMNSGQGPDLLGVCEVENEFVVQQLASAVNHRVTGRTYQIAHADTSDQRGVDVAFIYDPALLTAPADQRFQHVVMRRTGTREILQVNFRTVSGHTWAVFGNHWPSRRGGQQESAAYRATAGETLAYFHERTLEVHGAHTPVLVMGDFNDEPFNVSLSQHALSTRQRTKVLNATTAPRLWNLMWPIVGGDDRIESAGNEHAVRPGGTFYFQNTANVLDQFLVNKNMLTPRAHLRAEPGSVHIVTHPQGMVGTGRYPAPVLFGGMGKDVNQNGYSDHYPIAMHVEVA
ncbi:endonuclease/exonuclease/phosphatase [Streptomyces durbertensis]|uniref:Endonuclease/exonuclease/phosphatase n=1 Tax=Streptomyces durbertensis TaxID=2448886 RepID=A0ABR6EKV3_9ACTN|nr:endonuclease/exonuclease/phosphatase family protein [Streptomyces durbertensis]MBB1245965.1 endonuclease/exonuclease/phosphatase [Streptomyces durbertensis]